MKHALIIALVAIFALSAIFVGCEKNDGITAPPTSSNSKTVLQKSAGDAPFWAQVVPLKAGQTQVVAGYLYIWNDASKLYMTAVLNAGVTADNVLYGIAPNDGPLSVKNNQLIGNGTNLEVEIPLNNVSFIGGTSGPLSLNQSYTFIFHVSVTGAVSGTSLACEWAKDPNDNSRWYSTCQLMAYNLSSVSGSVSYDDCNGTATRHVNVANSQVTISNTVFGSTTVTTGSDGSYSSGLIPVGTWTVHSSYFNESQEATIAPAATVNFFSDTRPNGSCAEAVGNVQATYCVGNNTFGPASFAGATVTIAGANLPSGYSSSTTTDANGNYTFANLPAGDYTVTVSGNSPDNIASDTKSVNVTVGGDEGSYTASSVTLDLRSSVCIGGGQGDPDPEEACSLSQGYWFAKPQVVWAGNVTIGGKSYTQAEGKAIWNTANKGGMLNAKAAFLQVSAIKLSNVPSTASVWADVAICEAYFSSIPKLNPSSLPANSKTGANAAAGAAAGRIGNWIDNNHCLE